MLLQCLLLVLASYALEPTLSDHTVYRFSLDRMGDENDVKEFQRSLVKELGQNAKVQMSTRFRDDQLHRLTLQLTNDQGLNLSFKMVGFESFHLGIELDNNNKLTGLSYGFNEEKVTEVDLLKERRMRVRHIHKESESLW